MVGLTASDLTAEDRRVPSRRVEQIFGNDVWSRDQLAVLLRTRAQD